MDERDLSKLKIENSIETGEGYISVEYQKQEITRIRQNMPLNSPLSS